MWNADEWADLYGEWDAAEPDEHEGEFFCSGCEWWVSLDEIYEIDDIQYCCNCGEEIEEL